MRNFIDRRVVGIACVALVAAGCAKDPLNVVNTNQPEAQRALSQPADVERLISGSFVSWFDGWQNLGINVQMMNASFEFVGVAANFGMVERSQIPRIQQNNQVADGFAGQYFATWQNNYRALSATRNGAARLTSGTFSLGSPDANSRGLAFARLVQGLSLGHLAITYDSAFVVDETSNLDALQLQPYGAVMTAALSNLDKAITEATGKTWSLPSTWINGNAMTAAEFVRFARSYRARFRAAVARTPAERAAVNWNEVIADAQGGITQDFSVTADGGTVWYFGPQNILSFPGVWNQITYFLHGMADTSGAYQAWMANPDTDGRLPFLIRTPDRRFPQGDLAAQVANPRGLRFRYKAADGHVRAERGRWRWSFYKYQPAAWDPFWASANFLIGPFVIFQKTELDLLAAEGFIRTNRAAQALPLINATRVGVGGLPAATVDGATGGASCVPRLPNGTCGSLLETLKWEKRMETMGINYAQFWSDSRGWGDLMVGTQLSYAVPARDLATLQLPFYSLGGVGNPGSAPLGTYGY